MVKGRFVMQRPTATRVAASVTLAVITVWGVLSADRSVVTAVLYPVVVGIQAFREWRWTLTVKAKELIEVPGIAPARAVPWKNVTALVMPDAVWWRINPVLIVEGAPNIVLTAHPLLEELATIARKNRTPVTGDLGSALLPRSLSLWFMLLLLALLLLVAQILGPAPT